MLLSVEQNAMAMHSICVKVKSGTILSKINEYQQFDVKITIMIE